MRWRLPHLLSLAAFGLLGCGLSDYEKRMDDTRERLRAMEEEGKLLGDLIELPTEADAKGEKKLLAPFEVFLRLPVGIPGKFKGREATYQSANQPLFRYAKDDKEDVSVFFAAMMVLDPKEKKGGIESPPANAALPEDFRKHVRGGLEQYFLRRHNINPSFPDVAPRKEKKTFLRDGRERTLPFEVLELEDPRVQAPSKLFVYFHQWSDRQVAIVYQTPKQQAANQDFLKSMDGTLKSLEVTPVAAQKRKKFAK